MEGFQAKAVAAVRSRGVVCVVKVGELRAKALQMGLTKTEASSFISRTSSTAPVFCPRRKFLQLASVRPM
jgi:hypothetical protein